MQDEKNKKHMLKRNPVFSSTASLRTHVMSGNIKSNELKSHQNQCEMMVSTTVETPKEETTVQSVGSKHLDRLTNENSSYGRPSEGSKTYQRGLKAHSHVSEELRYLCEVIKDSGIMQEDGSYIITFGKLFQIYTVISDKVVGLLLRARKYDFVEFEGEMLYQRRDDYKLIRLKKIPPKDFKLTF